MLTFARRLSSLAGAAIPRAATAASSSQLLDVRSAKLLMRSDDPKLSAVELEFDEAEVLRIPLVWLRDHCRSPALYNWETNQRIPNCTNLFKKAKLAKTNDAMQFDERHQMLTLRWADGHESIFQTKELIDWAVFKSRDYDECASRTYWNGSTMRAIPSVSSKNFDYTVFSQLFVRFGIVAVLGVDARNEKATKALCQQIAPIHETFFGTFWVFGTDADAKPVDVVEEKIVPEFQPTGSHEDTAYGTDAIGPHTDGTYFENPPGVQVLHCLRPADEGGRTVLVDGFHIAQQLRRERPDLFDVLATMQIEHHYVEGTEDELVSEWENELSGAPEEEVPERKKDDKPKIHARSVSKPIIECFKHKIVQVRFNPYDRAPLRTLRVLERDEEEGAELNVERTVRFYEAYERFSQLAHDPANHLSVQLQPGTVIFVDNTRVMHARTAYKGRRKMCGCYLSRDGLLAKARPVLSAAFQNI